MQDPKPSKSALKREDQALKSLGQELIALAPANLDQLPLDERLRDAVEAASRMRAHGALRRQRQLIAKLLRQADATAIQSALAELQSDSIAEKRRFRLAEDWRDRLLDEGSAALMPCVDATAADERALRDVMTRLRQSRSEKSSKTARRELFRIVHDAIERQQVQQQAQRQ